MGRPYTVVQPLAFNNRSIVAIRGTDIFALDREDGRVKWETRVALISTLETAPDYGFATSVCNAVATTNPGLQTAVCRRKGTAARLEIIGPFCRSISHHK